MAGEAGAAEVEREVDRVRAVEAAVVSATVRATGEGWWGRRCAYSSFSI